ncbi:MAG: cardiolipin synthase ClsB [Castellaniella sp.]
MALLPFPSVKLDWRDGNGIDLLNSGADFFPALCAAVDAARHSVHLETYIFNLDATGRHVLDTLAAACARGVRVRVVIDGFGSHAQADELVARLQAMGVRWRIYKPRPKGTWRRRLSPSRLRRLHRKTAVIDRCVGFVGGINILDDYFDVPNDGCGPMPRFDFAVRLRGPLVADLLRAQRTLWLRMGWRRPDDLEGFQRRLSRLMQWRARRRPAPVPAAEPGQRAALVLRDNFRFARRIEKVYLLALREARRDVLIANAYFFPGRRLRNAMVEAARRGVRVRLMLQGRPEYPVQHWASRHMYAELLAGGVELYEYQPSYLHAKVAVIDDQAMVGSANLDPFSLFLAREANVWVDDAAFAQSLRTELEKALAQHCRRITSQAWNSRRIWQRFLDGVGYLVLRAGVAITGKSSEY